MLKITVKNLQDKNLISSLMIKNLIKRILKEERIKARGEITVSIVTDSLIKKLNQTYRKKNIPTDVLAFNISEPFNKENFFADIVVSADTARYNSKIYTTSLLKELKLYITHGLLHLLGYNHNTLFKKRVMLKKERKYVDK
jgi:probable rRNA maturation factor